MLILFPSFLCPYYIIKVMAKILTEWICFVRAIVSYATAKLLSLDFLMGKSFTYIQLQLQPNSTRPSYGGPGVRRKWYMIIDVS